MIQECETAFGLTKGEKESCFWFVKKGNLGRKMCVWLMLIEKKLRGLIVKIVKILWLFS